MEHIDTPQGRRIALMREAGTGPAVVFLGGFRSDMTGTKAAWLASWARERGRAFVRFDYSGHGQSGGSFEEGTIGAWAEDARAVLDLVPHPAVLVGSSMGGWIALLLARAAPDRIAGLVTIAAAPDFTEDGLWAAAPELLRARLMAEGRLLVPSDYGAPYAITRGLIESGRENLVLRAPLHLPFPTRMLQGTADREVPAATALRLLDHATGPDLRLTLVKDADHRFSSPRCLRLIGRAVEEVS
jgi:pimeloyl-ACP methyl ester carboxylesterase